MPSAIPERPSTSSGPGSSKAAGSRPNFDKRLSKDDMFLTGQMGKGRKKGPQPSVHGAKNPWMLTPEPSPQRTRMASPAPIVSPPARLPTPQSSASGEVPIGMALGSPTRDSTPNAGSPYVGSPQAGWQPQSQLSVQIGHVASPEPTPEPTVRRTKTQKRRLFGSLFGGRKHAEPPKEVDVEVNRSASSLAASVSKESLAPARSNTVASRKTPKYTPIIIKTTELPSEDSIWPSISESVPSVSTSSSGFLNVEIPDIRLERYSVMFSGVLNPNGTKASLLERRQATLEKLKTISDGIETEERTRPRRATSPQPMKSPAFSLFPQTPTRHSRAIGYSGAAMASTSSLAPPRGLTRSNTSPAYLPSPSRASFEPPHQSSPEHSRKEKKTVTIISPRTMDERNRAAQVEKLQEQQQAQQKQQQRSHAQPVTTTIHFHPNESSLILDSPTSDSSMSSSEDESEPDSPPTRRRPLPASLKPSIPSPQWQIITPPSSTSTTASATDTTTKTTTPPSSTITTATTRTKRTPSSSTSASTSTLRSSPSRTASLNNDADNDDDDIIDPSLVATRISVDESDAALKAAVEISIARQISISRQQRRMLMRPFGGQQIQQGKNGGVRGRSVTLGSMAVVDERRQQQQQQQQEQDVMLGGVVKGRVTPVMMMAAGDRRSERVVLDVVE